MVEGLLPCEEAEDGVESARGWYTDPTTRQCLDHSKRLLRASDLAEARDQQVERVAAGDTSIEMGDGFYELIDDGGRAIRVSYETEGMFAVFEAVLDALVEDVSESTVVAGAEGVGGEVIVVCNGGIVGEGFGN